MNATLAQDPGFQLATHINRLEADGTIRFYQTVQACHVTAGARELLDFGAGRGSGLLAAQAAGNRYKAFLQDLRSLGAHVTACDIDDAVHSHPAADRIALIGEDGRLPFEDESFDLIVSDNTFEHISQPEVVARELMRVLRPGGFICARTPNKYGYVALAARLMPDAVYGFALRKAQPLREDQDKFPVHYKLNDARNLRRHFAGASVMVTYPDVEPSYFFNSTVIKAAMRLVHAMTPVPLRPALIVLVRKG